jgi:hypothetical protein
MQYHPGWIESSLTLSAKGNASGNLLHLKLLIREIRGPQCVDLRTSFLPAVLILAMTFWIGCSTSSNSAKMANVQVTLSDPATCASPQGPFSHIYVTVTDVLIHQSSTASDNDPGWVDLTPNLKSNPVQVDLLGAANQCFLAQLGSNGIPAEFCSPPATWA